jgi:ribonucleoside-triphosphate reductase (thioredoxin)
MNDYQKFIAYSRYARWRDEDQRRETWPEVVERYTDWMLNHVMTNYAIMEPELCKELYDAILNLEVMPSMRCLMTAGPALDRTHVAGYNCAYLVVDHPRAFDEAMYILMCGTGVGYSVERQYTDKLPIIQIINNPQENTIVVDDSKEGWATALRSLISGLYRGDRPKWNTDKVRPAGARLKTFGGRASGPGPLEELFVFVTEIFDKARGRRLTSLECHDIMCKIADVVVVGGVRRSAMISLSDLNDEGLRYAKHGAWWENEPQRGLSNNSAVYLGKPSIGEFLREWQSLYDSKSGERGIFNRQASLAQASRNGRRLLDYDFGTNPCSEIILRPNQFCNLTEVVVRSGDNFRTLERKVRLATILGTFQSTLTNLRYLRHCWRRNTEEERLLGVSLTGIYDHPTLIENRDWLEHLKQVAIETNKEFAQRLGISPSVAITCVKPSGTVSQLVDSASGIHPRHSEFYIRTIRGDRKDPITQFMIDQGVPHEPDVTKPDDTMVFSFPHRAPDGALCRADLSAIDHLLDWKDVQEHWCEHKPSVTINVKEDEWLDVGAWVYKNFDCVSGVSFLPYSEHTYRQAPYQECTEVQYQEALAKMPESIDWSKLSDYEKEDTTTGTQEYACAAGFCEIT